MNHCAIRVLMILQGFVVFARADVSEQELQKWVDGSTLIFEGKIVSLGSNVNGIDASDNPMTVKVANVVFGNDTAVHNFGSLVDKELTVVNPLLTGPWRKVGASAVFFVNPLMYEQNIAVTVTAIADDEAVKDLSTRLTHAVEMKRQKPLNDEEKSADSIVTGVVEGIRVLPAAKVNRLRALDNGYDLYSEHAPRWREAVIRVQNVTKGKADANLLVVFPSTEDRAWAKSPKFTLGQAGTWLLHGQTHGTMQLNEGRARILLADEAFERGQLKVYTALRPEDFRPAASTGENEH